MAPGVIAGISNVDACAVLCLLSVGSAYKYSLLWALALGFFICVFSLQLASEITLATGRGLVKNLKERLNSRTMPFIIVTLVAANLSLISVEIGGIVVALNILLGMPLSVATAVSALIVFAVSSTKSLRLLNKVLIALSLGLSAFLIAALRSGLKPEALALGFLRPSLSTDAGYWMAVLAVIGMIMSPNTLLYEASDLAEGGVNEGSLVKALTGPLAGSAISLIMWVAIVACGACLPSEPGGLLEAFKDFTSTLGPAFAVLLAIGLFAGSLLTAVVTLQSTAALLSEAYGWRKDGGAWVAWTALITLASALPMHLMPEPFKVAIASSIICGLATTPVLVSVAVMSLDASLMRGLEVKGPVKALTLLITGFFVAIELGGIIMGVGLGS